MRRLLTPSEFAAEASRAPRALWRSSEAAPELGSGERLVRYYLSDSSIARDGNTIATKGWQLDNYRLNPVFLWAHDTAEPPIGKMVEIGAVGDWLMGTVRYPEPDEYPFADTIYRLVKGGYLNAVSVSWMPLEWQMASGRDREPGSIDFKRQELLEVSQVPVPAMPTAIAAARAAGIDTGPLYAWAERVLDAGDLVMLPKSELNELRRAAKMPARSHSRAAGDDWKVGAARDLPIAETDSWDGPAAAKRMLDDAGFDGDKPDSEKARRGFLVYDAAKPDERGSYKEPFADIIDGELKATSAGIRATASRLPETDVPESVREDARGVLDNYEERAKSDGAKRAALIAKMRGLYEVGWLAQLLCELAWLQECVEFEAAIEEDGSQVPAQLAAVVKALGQVLLDMTPEEVAELLADGAGERAMTNGQRAIRAIAALTRAAGSTKDTLTLRITADTREVIEQLARAGRVISAENERCLREAHEHLTRGCDMVRGLIDLVADPANDLEPQDPDAAPDGDDDDLDRARARLSLLRLKAA